MNIDWTPIFNAVILLIGAGITTIAIPYIKIKTGKTNYEKFLKYVEIAVKAADQIFPAEKREEKKAYVYGYVKTLGFNFDELTIDNAIEAMVLTVHNALKEVTQ